MEDGFGLLVVIVVNYATGLLSYKDMRYFLGAPVLEGDRGVHGLNTMEGCGEII